MKLKLIKKTGILAGIFLAAMVLYVFLNYGQNAPSGTVYTAMDEPSLPVVYVQMYGQRMNRMYGYRQEMGGSAAMDSLTVLPQDRALQLDITLADVPVLAVRYEIRSLDRSRLVEETDVKDWTEQEDGLRVVLPIQNLLTKDRQYQLRVELNTEQFGTVYYYTRILWTDDTTVESMIRLAADFSAKTFSYEDARELVTYLESNDTEDNSTFGRTTIRSSFSQITWGRLKMQPAGEVSVTLRELDGIMGCVMLSYLASRTDGSGETEYYEVEENFTMKWNPIRTYLMNYERHVNEIVSGGRENFSGKRIMLGITNDDEVNVVRAGQVLAYRANRDLWSYDQRSGRLVKVFSFRSDDPADVRSSNRNHDIRILRVSEEGDMDFLVYGYQNRGNHEGESGIAAYRYDASGNGLVERFFIPDSRSFEELKQDLEQLSYYSARDMLYLYLDHAVYGIDMTSNESMVVADALEDGSFAVSADQARFAWQDGGKRYQAHVLHLMDFDSGAQTDIHGASEGEFVRTLGFVGRDLVYGLAREDALWVRNGRAVDLPMYAVEIMNDRMLMEARYEKEGSFVAGVTVDESRIHLNLMKPVGNQDYIQEQEDTIVCNEEMGPEPMDGIGWYASQDKERVYFVQMDAELRSGQNVRLLFPKRLSADSADRLELQPIYELEGLRFYACGNGRLLGVTTNFTDALQLAYEQMGFVTDQNLNMLWNRVSRADQSAVPDLSAACAAMERHLDGFTESRSYANDSLILLDARGCPMQQLLSFISQGMPVFGCTGEGEYLILSGYDSYNVTVYDPRTGETYKAGLNDSTEYFRRLGNDFICAVRME